jgi:hypothetical protein
VVGVAISVAQRRSRGQLPPGLRADGHALDGARRGNVGDDPVPQGPRTGRTRIDLRAYQPRQRTCAGTPALYPV